MAMTETQKRYYATPRAKAMKKGYSYKYNQSMRYKILRHYSGTGEEPRCACCGETEPHFLTLDHINGNGKAHRAKLGQGIAFYHSLRRLGYPKGLRVLCMNCNHALGHYGRCPHNALV